ncbi:LVIVD repeat-containing protein, partial [Kaarinaea lacus]
MSTTSIQSFSFFRLIIVSHFCLLLLLLAACSPIAIFTDKSQITLAPSKDVSAILQVDNWSDSHSLTIVNGGPYLENSIIFPIEGKFLDKMDGHIISVDINNDLHLVDFNVKPAKQTLGISLINEVTAIATYHDQIFIGFKETGLLKFNTSIDKKSVKKQQISSAPNITQIKIHNNVLYYLSDGRKITSYPLVPDAQNNLEPQSWDLPVVVNDFAVIEDGFALLSSSGLGIVERANASTFTSSFPLQGSKRQITVQENIALVADGNGGMVLIDIQDRQNLRWLGSHNKLRSIYKIQSAKNKAYVIDRGVRLASINISNVELPITGSFYKPEGEIQDFLLGDNAVYVATSTGIEKVIFPDASHGQISNEGINQGGTRRAFITGHLAYVADWFSGLHIYDISNPATPRHIGNFHTPGSSKGVIVENGYAYVGDDDHGLQIVDVRNPEKPVLAGSVLTTGLAYTLKKRGDLVFLADHRGGFHIINVADVSKPFIVSSHNTSGKSWAIDVKDNIVFVADDNSGLLVFDISNLKQPKQIGQFDPGGYAEDVAIRDNIAYVSFFDKGFYLLDISTPNKPVLISHIDIPGNARSVVLQDHYAYIAGWESGLQVVDISNSKSPHIVGSFDTQGSAWGVDIYENHAYVWDWWGGVKVINVTNPAKPEFTAQYHANSTINKLRQKNNFIYTANQTAGVQVFDINNVLNPIWTTGADVSGSVVDVWPSQQSDTLFAISDQAGLIVFDITDPFYITRLGSYKINGVAKIVREYNDKVYVATKNGKLLIFDSSNIHKLTAVQTLDIDAEDMWVDRQTVYVASAAEGLVTFPLTSTGRVNPKKQVISEAMHKVTASEKYLVAATDSHNISIWNRHIKGIVLLNTFEIDDRILALALNSDTL